MVVHGEPTNTVINIQHNDCTIVVVVTPPPTHTHPVDWKERMSTAGGTLSS